MERPRSLALQRRGRARDLPVQQRDMIAAAVCCYGAALAPRGVPVMTKPNGAHKEI